MTQEHQQNDPASPVPEPWPLTGEPAPTDQPDPSEVLPTGNAPEVEMLESDEDPTSDRET
jgi:hypothetical protein